MTTRTWPEDVQDLARCKAALRVAKEALEKASLEVGHCGSPVNCGCSFCSISDALAAIAMAEEGRR